MKKIKVFIVDDHKLLAQGIIQMLNTSDDFEVIGYVTSGEEAINALEACTPDVVLMDIKLKKMTGIEASRWIKERRPDTRIVLLSMEVRKEFLSAGIQCGISGYLHKDIDKDTLFEALRAVHNGGQYFTDALTKLVFEDFFNHEKAKKVVNIKLPDQLTHRENEVLALVAEGKSSREIGEMLFISIKTVDTHKSNILDKLGLKNSAELTKYAIKNNIITI